MSSEDRISLVTWINVVLAAVHIPVLGLRVSILMGFDTSVFEWILLAGPATAFLAAPYSYIRGDWFDLFVNLLILVGYIGMYLIVLLSAG